VVVVEFHIGGDHVDVHVEGVYVGEVLFWCPFGLRGQCLLVIVD